MFHLSITHREYGPLLAAFAMPRLAIVVCLVPTARKTEQGILILPWKQFLEGLWAGQLIR